MTERRVNTRPVSTYIQPSRAGLMGVEQRSRQVAGVMRQLGVNMQESRQRQQQEDAAAVSAEANNRARVLAAEYMPQIEAEMQKPETYKMSAEEFASSPIFKLGADRIENDIPYPEHRKRFMAQYQELMMRRYAEGRTKHETEERNHTASLAQQGAAHAGGIGAQMSAYDDALASGVTDDEAFGSGLATAVLLGPQYLSQFASARDWTPEQDIQIQTQLNKARSEFNMEAAVAYKRANAEQERVDRYQALAAVQARYGDSLSNDQNASITADLMTLREEIASEQFVVQNLGILSADAMANGEGMRGGRRLPISDIKRLQDREVYRAVQSGDYERVAQLAALPGDEPDALKETFGQLFGSIESIDPNDPEAVQRLESAMTYSNVISDNLGAARMKALLGNEAYSLYQEFAGNAQYMGLPQAIEQYKNVRQMLANGDIPRPENWNETQRTVTEHAMEVMTDWSLFSPGSWFPSADSMNRASMESQLAPMFKQWRAMHLTEDQMKTRAERMMRESSWSGYLNGGVLGAHIGALTQGQNGNPYGTRSAEDLWEEFKSLKQSEIQADIPDITELEVVIGYDPNTVFLMDKGGIPIPNSMMRVDEVTDFIRRNVPTTKQELINERDTDRRRSERITETILDNPNALGTL